MLTINYLHEGIYFYFTLIETHIFKSILYTLIKKLI